MPLDAGKLDREIVLQTAVSVQSSSGESTLDWNNATSKTLWAEWKPAGSVEAWKAQSRIEGVIDGVFRIYWRDDVSPTTTRIVWDGKTYDVRPPVEGGRHEYLDVPVSAIAD